MSCSTSSSVRGHPVCTAVVLTRWGGGVVQVAHEFCCIGSSSKSLACIPSQGGAGGAAVDSSASGSGAARGSIGVGEAVG